MARRQRVSPTWLSDLYKERRRRTVALIRGAIEHLKKHKQPISLANVVAATKEIDELKRGLSLTTILRNSDSYELYVQHRAWKPRITARRPVTRAAQDPAKLVVKVGRDAAAARRRLLKLSKQELIERLMHVERCYAVFKSRWLRASSDMLERTP